MKIPIRFLALDFLLLAALAVWIVWWPTNIPPRLPGPRVELPLVDRAYWRDGPEGPDDPLIVTIARDGVVYLGDDRVDCEPLRQAVGRAIAADIERRKAFGGAGLADLPGGGKTTKLPVVLRVDRTSRWRDVHRVLCRLGAYGVCDVSLLVTVRGGWNRWRSRVPAGLPTEHEFTGIEIERVRTPDAALPLGEGDVRIVGEVAPAPDTPFEEVVPLLQAFHRAGIRSIDFLGPGEVRAFVVPLR